MHPVLDRIESWTLDLIGSVDTSTDVRNILMGSSSQVSWLQGLRGRVRTDVNEFCGSFVREQRNVVGGSESD